MRAIAPIAPIGAYGLGRSKLSANDAVFIQFTDKKIYSHLPHWKIHRRTHCTHLRKQRSKMLQQRAFFTQERPSVTAGNSQRVKYWLQQFDTHWSQGQNQWNLLMWSAFSTTAAAGHVGTLASSYARSPASSSFSRIVLSIQSMLLFDINNSQGSVATCLR